MTVPAGSLSWTATLPSFLQAVVKLKRLVSCTRSGRGGALPGAALSSRVKPRAGISRAARFALILNACAHAKALPSAAPPAAPIESPAALNAARQPGSPLKGLKRGVEMGLGAKKSDTELPGGSAVGPSRGSGRSSRREPRSLLLLLSCVHTMKRGVEPGSALLSSRKSVPSAALIKGFSVERLVASASVTTATSGRSANDTRKGYAFIPRDPALKSSVVEKERGAGAAGSGQYDASKSSAPAEERRGVAPPKRPEAAAPLPAASAGRVDDGV